MDRPRQSNNVTIDDGHTADLFEHHARREQKTVPPSVVAAQKSMTDALRLAIQVSGLDDKQVYMDLGIDAGQWSRIFHGGAHFPHEKWLDLFTVLGNRIPLEWLAHQCGFELKPLRSSLERELDEEKKHSRELEDRLRIITNFMKDIRG